LRGARAYTLHVLGEEVAEGDTGNKIIQGCEVVRSIEVEDKSDKLLGELTNKENYEPVSRRCKMYPQYAIEIEGKLVAVFDLESCPRIEYLANEEETVFDIKMENSIKAELEKLVAK